MIIREFREDDLWAIVDLSLRAWEPIFDSLRRVLGDDVFLRLHPDWREDQADAVRSACRTDPDYQRRGIGSRLTEFATEHMRGRGMHIAVVETGGDRGHEPARAVYETAGFTLLPIARYFRLLD